MWCLTQSPHHLLVPGDRDDLVTLSNLRPTKQVVRWGERLLQVIWVKVGEWSTIDNCFNLYHSCVQLVIREPRSAHNLPQASFGGAHQYLKKSTPPGRLLQVKLPVNAIYRQVGLHVRMVTNSLQCLVYLLEGLSII